MCKRIETHSEWLGIVAVVLMYISWCFWSKFIIAIYIIQTKYC